MSLPRLQRHGQKRILLEAMKYAVLSATSDAQAMRIFDLLALDGVLLDHESLMKDEDTMFEKIYQQIHVPVIVTLIDVPQRKLAKLIEQGGIDYLPKPIDLVLLKQKCLRYFT